MLFPVEQCLVSFKTTQSVKLRVLFESLDALLGDGIIDFTPDGVFLSASTSTSCMVFMNLLKPNIDDYFCSQHVECGIQFRAMYSYLKNVTDTDVVAIQVTMGSYTGEGGKGPRLYLFVYNAGTEGKDEAYCNRYEIRMRMLERIPFATMIPSALYMDACVTLPSTTFQRFLRSHDKVESGSPDLDFQILARIPEAENGQLPTRGEVFFVSDGQDANLVTSSSFPIYRALDDLSNTFDAPAFVLPDELDDEVKNTTDLAPMDIAVAQPPPPPSPPPPQVAPKEDSVKFIVDALYIQKETSIFYSHRSSDKQDLYSLKMLMEIAKMTNMSPSVRLFLSVAAPLAIMYDVGTLGSIVIFIAPRADEAVTSTLASVASVGSQGSLLLSDHRNSMQLVTKENFNHKGSGKRKESKPPKEKVAKKRKNARLLMDTPPPPPPEDVEAPATTTEETVAIAAAPALPLEAAAISIEAERKEPLEPPVKPVMSKLAKEALRAEKLAQRAAAAAAAVAAKQAREIELAEARAKKAAAKAALIASGQKRPRKPGSGRPRKPRQPAVVKRPEVDPDLEQLSASVDKDLTSDDDDEVPRNADGDEDRRTVDEVQAASFGL